MYTETVCSTCTWCHYY